MIRFTDAIVLRQRDSGEGDSSYLLMLEDSGLDWVVAPGARSGRQRAGALQPFHTVRVGLSAGRGSRLRVAEAEIRSIRDGLVRNLECIQDGATALRWARSLLPMRTRDAAVWGAVEQFLDSLEVWAISSEGKPEERVALLAKIGLQLIRAAGYELEMRVCIACGRPCPAGRSVTVDVFRGGIVCQNCGGASRPLSAVSRQWVLDLWGDEDSLRDLGEAPGVLKVREELLALIESTVAAHSPSREGQYD